MSVPRDQDTGHHITFFDVMILVLSIYVLGALMADTFLDLPRETSRVLDIIDNVICIFFLADFGYRFYHAKSKWSFMKWGWIDLVASIPAIGPLRAGRALRLIRIIRVLRAFRSLTHIVAFLFRNKRHGTFSSVCILSVLLVIFSSIAILQLEVAEQSNIKTAEDALWWSYVTITTVGYGDKYPVTTGGRIIAAILITAGVGLFGTFTGFISSWFIKDENEAKAQENQREA